jgi:predicted alpha/beta superfamily hydrolase
MQRQSIQSAQLGREVLLDLVMANKQILNPDNCRILLVNDGFDAKEISLEEAVQDFVLQYPDEELIAVAIHVGERKQEYGVSKRPDFAARGAKAEHYAAFVVKELLPWIQTRFGIKGHKDQVAMIGFSLGALSAFDVVWNHSNKIGTAGLFSGSFWWRAKDLKSGYTSSDRIAHKMVAESTSKPDLKLWFQTGGMDESEDRDDDGLIDSIGDTVDLILAIEKKGFVPGDDIEYVELGNGRHDHKTMGKVLPQFLKWWKFAKKIEPKENAHHI